MKVQITSIVFDLDSDDVISQPHLQESLQEEYVGLIFDLDVPNDSDDEVIEDELVEEVTASSGWLIQSLNYRHILS